MNKEIELRTQQKLKQSQLIQHHNWSLTFGQMKHQYIILPGVFSPAIFMGTAWLTQEVLKHISKGSYFLEIGTGCGVTSIQVALKVQGCKVTASDINPKAIQNTIINLKNFNCQFEVVQSDMFQKLQNTNYDVIYWNYPFHPSDKNPNQLSFLEKAIMDPDYNMLKKYLLTSFKHLKENGFLLIGFSYIMGDLQLLQELAKKSNWKYLEVARMVDGGSMCLIKLWI